MGNVRKYQVQAVRFDPNPHWVREGRRGTLVTLEIAESLPELWGMQRDPLPGWLVFGTEPIVIEPGKTLTFGPPLPPPTFVPDPARDRQIFLDSAMIELMARTDFSPAVAADRAEALWGERERRRRGA